MSKKFPLVTLSGVVTSVKRSVVPVPGTTYRQIGVKLWGQGAYEREPMDGAQTKYRTLFRVEAGDIIVNKIWARNGSVAIVDESLGGCYGSSEFPIFAPIREKLDCRWLHWLTKTRSFWNQCDEKSRGTSGKNRIRPERFLEIKMPLPPLPEQRRIVVKIEDLSAKIEEVKKLRREAIESAEAVVDSALEKIIKEGRKRNWNFASFDSACDINPSKRDISYDDDFFVSFVPMAAVDDKTGRITEYFERPYGEVKKGYKWFVEGDVIFARITPCMENGKIAIAKNLKNRVGFGSTEFHVLRPKENILSEWIHYLTRRSTFRKLAEKSFKGTAGQQRVKKSFFYNQKILLPPTKKEQRRIVAYLDNLQEKAGNIKRLQLETQSELDALIPSILAKAFKGEL